MGATVSRRMSKPLQDSASLRRPFWLLGAPLLLLVIALVPVLAGLAGTVGPAASASAWQELFATPGLGRSLMLSFSSGVAAALLSLALAHGLLAALTTPQAVAARARWRCR
jgi:ABC-type Fe3+ transport system permease subunit